MQRPLSGPGSLPGPFRGQLGPAAQSMSPLPVPSEEGRGAGAGLETEVAPALFSVGGTCSPSKGLISMLFVGRARECNYREAGLPRNAF